MSLVDSRRNGAVQTSSRERGCPAPPCWSAQGLRRLWQVAAILNRKGVSRVPFIYALANHARFLFAILALSLIAVAVACAGEPTATHTPVPFTGKWGYQDEVDSRTLARQVGIGLNSESGFPPALGIRCSEGYPLEFTLILEDDIEVLQGDDIFGRVNVRHRIDSGPIEELEWQYAPVASGYTYLHLLNEDVRIIKGLFNAESFVLQIPTPESGYITAAFRPAGIYWAVKPVLEACDVEIN